MNHKPVPLFAGSTRATCPYCGQTSYSSAGFHPQCAVRAADQEWSKRMKQQREAVMAVAPQVVKSYQRACPKCDVVQHVRCRKCQCGHIFATKSRLPTG